jgi:hypothetical protein
MMKYFTNEFFMPVKPFKTTKKMLRQPMIEVYLHALMQVEDILIIICETQLDKQ